MVNGQNNQINDSLLYNNSGYGILIGESPDNILYNNTIYGDLGTYGIAIWGNNDTVQQNIITDQCLGVYLYNNQGTSVFNNTIYKIFIF